MTQNIYSNYFNYRDVDKISEGCTTEVFKVFQAKGPKLMNRWSGALLHILYKIVFYIKLVL